MLKKLIVVALVLAVALPVFAAEKGGYSALLKDKQSLGCGVTGGYASYRIWPSDDFGIQGSVGLSLGENYVSMPLTIAALFPVFEAGNFAIIAAPGITFGYTSVAENTSTVEFGAGADVLFEVALPVISNALSIGSGIGLWLGMNANNYGGTSNSSFFLNALTVTPVYVRYYF
ncbi:MAG: hypothetical protein LLG37_02900 [Spirochaetia bacterium]|nr:hypothetical protein [Spirochaetia bacterium]